MLKKSKKLYKMSSKIILLLLITTISSKINELSTDIEFDVVVPLAETNQFTFTNKAQEAKFYLVEMESDSSLLNYTYKCQGSEGTSGNSDEHYFIIKAQQGECSLKIDTLGWTSQTKAEIWIHPLENKIVATLEKNHRYLLKHYVGFDEKYPSFTYSVSNLAKDTKAKFDYRGSTINIDGQKFKLKNPFRICQGSDCKDDITEYTFINGTEYTIEIKPEELNTGSKTYYYMDSFSFYQEGGDETDTSDTSDGSDERPTSIPIPTAGNYILMNPIIYLILLLFI